MDADDGRRGVDVAHDEGDGGFDAAAGCGMAALQGSGSVDEAFEAEDAEVSPAGGEVGVGDLADAGEGHMAGL